MGAGYNATRGLELNQLFNTRYPGADTGAKIQLIGSAGPTSIAASSAGNLAAVVTLPDQINSQQDGYLFEYLFAQMAPADTSGELTLTDLQTTIVTAAGVLPVAFIAGAYPTLVTPIHGSLIGFQTPPLITGADMLFYARVWGGIAGFAFPAKGLRLALSMSFKNADAGAAHSISITIGCWVRKVTGVAE